MGFLSGLLANYGVEALIALVFSLLPIFFTKWFPNEWFYKKGVKLGRTSSQELRKRFGVGNWEGIENSVLGSVFSFVRGFEEGANEDDEKSNGK